MLDITFGFVTFCNYNKSLSYHSKRWYILNNYYNIIIGIVMNKTIVCWMKKFSNNIQSHTIPTRKEFYILLFYILYWMSPWPNIIKSAGYKYYVNWTIYLKHVNTCVWNSYENFWLFLRLWIQYLCAQLQYLCHDLFVIL